VTPYLEKYLMQSQFQKRKKKANIEKIRLETARQPEV
jgi:hypothetical protein